MISISNLFEGTYEPWMVGTAKQLGGKGYPTADLRMTKPPPGQLLAQQKREEQMSRAQLIDALRQLRRQKNPTEEERAQGAI